ncbi:MAG TPA: DUF4215 domain-containing protein, partial [Polyangiaceae bacterium]|nr:DUF4215 domain-containing protein [Polyangiaceae bacterium]
MFAISAMSGQSLHRRVLPSSIRSTPSSRSMFVAGLVVGSVVAPFVGCGLDSRESNRLRVNPASDAAMTGSDGAECAGGCSDGTECSAGVCRRPCQSGSACAAGQVCDLGWCYGPGGDGSAVSAGVPPEVSSEATRAREGNLAAPGEPCSAEGASECLGAAQALRRTCRDGVWQMGEACAAGNACERASGECAAIASECASASEGSMFCDAAGQLSRCGADLVSVEVLECVGKCVNGQCAPASCGDGSTQPNEACDDGNTDNTDTCTNACALPRCGDGFIQGAEACDDGNGSDNDACTNACSVARCGDGVVRDGVETCDDGNAVPGDGCSALCRVEVTGVACGYYHSCALLGSGSVRCFGDNNNGDLGVGASGRRGDGPNEMGRSLPGVDLGSGRRARQIATGYGHSCA